MSEPIDPAPTVSFEDITFRCVCGEVIIIAWDADYENDGVCPECGEAYSVHAEPSVDITVLDSTGAHYCEGSY